MRDYNVIIEKDQGGYYISKVIGIKGCHTQAKSLDKLIERTKDAIALCLRVQKDSCVAVHSDVKFVGLHKVEVDYPL